MKREEPKSYWKVLKPGEKPIPYEAQKKSCEMHLTVQQANAIFNSMMAKRKRKWFIRFNLGKYKPGERNYGVWPKLFDSREEAQMAMDCLPIFLNKHLAGIKSVTVEQVRLR